MNFSKYIVIIGLFFVSNFSSYGQVIPPSNEDEYEKEYQKRIKKDYIFGVYIPKDLADAFIQLNKLIDDESKAKFKNAPEAVAVKKLHFSFGRWMSYNWSFYEGSRFSEYLKNLGIYHPDDMSTFVMLSYHRNLNRVPLQVKEQITQIQYKRQKEKDDKLKAGEVISEEKRTRQN